MPSILRVYVHGARNLPVMDQRHRLADSYCEVAFGKQPPRRTAVVKKSLAPIFSSAFKLEVPDDSELITEPLVFRVLDRDYIQDDVIGVVMVGLEPLMFIGRGGPGHERVMSGWLPLYDSLEGVRGELHVTVRLHFFGAGAASNSGLSGAAVVEGALATGDPSGAVASGPQHATGVSFFGLSRLDPGLFPQQALLSFVEELAVEDDPEFAVVDSFRSARKSNENRQLLLHRLSYRLREAIARKVAAVGGNAVLAYQQHFDVEGDSGIVGRAYGTAARIVPAALPSPRAAAAPPVPSSPTATSGIKHSSDRTLTGASATGTQLATSVAAVTRTPSILSVASSTITNGSSSGNIARRARLQIEHTAGAPGADAYAGVDSVVLRSLRSGVGRSGSVAGVRLPPDAVASAPYDPTEPPEGAMGGGYDGSLVDAGNILSLDGGTGADADGVVGALSRRRRTSSSSSSSSSGGGTAIAEPLPSSSSHHRGHHHHHHQQPVVAPQPLVRHNFITSPGRVEDVQLFSVTQLPPGIRAHVGGLVAVRSVKFLGRLQASSYDQETRDRWWAELREELRSHASKLFCSQVVGYRETAHICGDACVLSVSGTAVRLRNTAPPAALLALASSAAAPDGATIDGDVLRRLSKKQRRRLRGRLAARLGGGAAGSPGQGRARLARPWYLALASSAAARARELVAHIAALRKAATARASSRSPQHSAAGGASVALGEPAPASSLSAPSSPYLGHGALPHWVGGSSRRSAFFVDPPLGSQPVTTAFTTTFPLGSQPGSTAVAAGDPVAAGDGEGGPATAPPSPALSSASPSGSSSAPPSPALQPTPATAADTNAPVRSGSSFTLARASRTSSSSAAVKRAAAHGASKKQREGGKGSAASSSSRRGHHAHHGSRSGRRKGEGGGRSGHKGSSTHRHGNKPGAASGTAAHLGGVLEALPLGGASSGSGGGGASDLPTGFVSSDPLSPALLPELGSTDRAHGGSGKRSRTAAALAQAASMPQLPCSFLHVPYHRSGAVFNNLRVTQCRACRRHWVPSVVLASIEPPEGLPTCGPGVYIESRVVRRKDRSTGEAECVQLSRELVFLEFELHQQLLLKMKLAGRNSAWAVRSTVAFNGSLIVGTMSATAVYVTSLPPPPQVVFPRRVGDGSLAALGLTVGGASRPAIDDATAEAMREVSLHHLALLQTYRGHSAAAERALRGWASAMVAGAHDRLAALSMTAALCAATAGHPHAAAAAASGAGAKAGGSTPAPAGRAHHSHHSRHHHSRHAGGSRPDVRALTDSDGPRSAPPPPDVLEAALLASASASAPAASPNSRDMVTPPRRARSGTSFNLSAATGRASTTGRDGAAAAAAAAEDEGEGEGEEDADVVTELREVRAVTGARSSRGTSAQRQQQQQQSQSSSTSSRSRHSRRSEKQQQQQQHHRSGRRRGRRHHRGSRRRHGRSSSSSSSSGRSHGDDSDRRSTGSSSSSDDGRGRRSSRSSSSSSSSRGSRSSHSTAGSSRSRSSSSSSSRSRRSRSSSSRSRSSRSSSSSSSSSRSHHSSSSGRSYSSSSSSTSHTRGTRATSSTSPSSSSSSSTATSGSDTETTETTESGSSSSSSRSSGSRGRGGSAASDEGEGLEAAAEGANRASRRRRLRAALAAEAQRTYVLEIDDEQAEDALAALHELQPPPGLSLVSTEAPFPCMAPADGTPVFLPTHPVPLTHLPAALPLGRSGAAAGDALSPPSGASPSAAAPRNLRLVVLVLRAHWRDLASGATLLGGPRGGGGGGGGYTAPTYAGGGTGSGNAAAGGVGGQHHHFPDTGSQQQHGGAPAHLGSARYGFATHEPGTYAHVTASLPVPFPLHGGPARADGGSAGAPSSSWYAGVAYALGFSAGGMPGGGGGAPGSGLGQAFPPHHHSVNVPSHSTSQGSAPGSSSAPGGGTGSADAAPSSSAGGHAVPRTDGEALSRLFHTAYGLLSFHLRNLAPCTMAALRCQLGVPEPDVLELLVTGMAIREAGLWLPDGEPFVAVPKPFEGDAIVRHGSAASQGPLAGDAFGGSGGGSDSELGLGIVIGGSAALALQQAPGALPASMRSFAPPSVARVMLASVERYHRELAFQAHAMRTWAERAAAMRGEAALALALALAAKQQQNGVDSNTAPPPSPRGVAALLPVPPSPFLGGGAPGAAAVTPGPPPSPSARAAAAPAAADPAAAAGKPHRGSKDWSLEPPVLHRAPPSSSLALPHPAGPPSDASSGFRGFSMGVSGRSLHASTGEVVGRQPQPQQPQPGHGRSTRDVEVTPLSYVPGWRVRRYLGRIDASFIRESLAVRQEGGLSAFSELLIAEANAVVRAQAAALGATHVLNYRLVPRESSLRAAAYVLVSISADAVELHAPGPEL